MEEIVVTDEFATTDIMVDTGMLEPEQDIYEEHSENRKGLSNNVILGIVIAVCAVLGIVLGIILGKRAANK